jgi:hypothetical protein
MDLQGFNKPNRGTTGFGPAYTPDTPYTAYRIRTRYRTSLGVLTVPSGPPTGRDAKCQPGP